MTASEILWIPSIWHSLFIVVNLFQLFFSRWRSSFTALDPVENFLAKTILENFPKHDVKSFTSCGDLAILPAGERLIQAGVKIDQLFCILAGEAEISSKGSLIAVFGPGKFLGEMSLLTQSITRADVRAKSDLKILSWSYAEIDKWVAADEKRLGLLQTALGRQVVEELLQQNTAGEELGLMAA